MTSAFPPDYYTWHPVCECKDIVSHFPYNPGVAIAYIWRSGRKPDADPVDDLQKAIDHLRFEIDRIKTQRDTASEAAIKARIVSGHGGRLVPRNGGDDTENQGGQ